MFFFSFFFFLFPDYAFQFPHKGTDDYIQLWGMPSLRQFTLCLWTKSNDTAPVGTLFSYAVLGEDNEIVIINKNGFQLHINGKKRFVTLFLKKTPIMKDSVCCVCL